MKKMIGIIGLIAMQSLIGISAYADGIRKTGRILDLAVEGSGCLEVMAPDGRTYFTRGGRFVLSVHGDIQTESGYTVIPLINVPRLSRGMEIDPDGTVWALSHTGKMKVGSILLTQIYDIDTRDPIESGLFRKSDNDHTVTPGRPGQNGLGRLRSGYLPTSWQGKQAEETTGHTASGEGDVSLRIYLPRETMANDHQVRLDDIAILRGEKTLTQVAGAIDLGQFSVTGQEMVIDRATILNRLKANGIDTDRVGLSGAVQIHVSRKETVIAGPRFVEAAEKLLDGHKAMTDVSKYSVIRVPEDFVLPAEKKDVELVPRFSQYSTLSKARVWVSVQHNGKEIGGEEVIFELQYECRRAVAAKDIETGEMLGPENTTIETYLAGAPQSENWQSPYGQVAGRPIRKGRIVDGRLVEPKQNPVVIKRRQGVLIKIETPVMFITAIGEALEDGRIGELIRVRNNNNRNRTIIARVQKDGSVAPVY